MFPLQKITILFLRKPNNSFVQIQVNLQRSALLFLLACAAL